MSYEYFTIKFQRQNLFFSHEKQKPISVAYFQSLWKWTWGVFTFIRLHRHFSRKQAKSRYIHRVGRSQVLSVSNSHTTCKGLRIKRHKRHFQKLKGRWSREGHLPKRTNHPQCNKTKLKDPSHPSAQIP